jgi:PAS domain S-box-containing protein
MEGSTNGTPEFDEGFFRTAFDAAPDGIVVVDADARTYVYANQVAADLVGTPVEILIGRTTFEVPKPRDPGMLDELWSRIETEGSLEGRYRFLDGEGRPRTVDFRARGYFLPNRHIAVLRERQAPRMPLSPREREVLTALALGRTGAQVAQALELSPETVRTHIRNAMEKLGASTRTHAIALAIASGEIDV